MCKTINFEVKLIKCKYSLNKARRHMSNITSLIEQT